MDIWIIVWASFASYLNGPAKPYSDCCAYLNDLDNDGDVDLRDFARLQNGWSCPPEGSCGYVYDPKAKPRPTEGAP